MLHIEWCDYGLQNTDRQWTQTKHFSPLLFYGNAFGLNDRSIAIKRKQTDVICETYSNTLKLTKSNSTCTAKEVWNVLHSHLHPFPEHGQKRFQIKSCLFFKNKNCTKKNRANNDRFLRKKNKEQKFIAFWSVQDYRQTLKLSCLLLNVRKTVNRCKSVTYTKLGALKHFKLF